MNKSYRLIYNEITQTWVAASELCKGRGKRTAHALLLTAVGALAAGGQTAAFATTALLPTGGNIVSGAATITQTADVMTVQQGTQKLAIDWQSFNIGAGQSVNFVQPSTTAVALNRIVGSDASAIYGSLTANGQVFLVNPNGILFSPSAQVNVGGIVASTLNISNDDFLAGRNRLSGDSNQAVTNQGTISAGNGGGVALVAARVVNEGTIEAPAGQVLLGAGRTVTVDFGGPVKLEVEEAALNAAIENSGTIRANGGTVLLTAHAAGDLMSTVINQTGVIEAQTLATGEKGTIILLGDMTNDRVVVSGRLDASAPNGGDGGFIETSGARLNITDNAVISTSAAQGQSGRWLLDPYDFTVASSGGDITGAALTAALGVGNVTIQTTNTSATCTGATCAAGDSTGNGDIFVNDTVSWSANALTLNAWENIWINGNMTGTGSASLELLYAQSSTNSLSTYTIKGTLTVPTFSAKYTTGANSASTYTTVRPTYLNNGALRFGTGVANSVNSDGLLLQPFYYNAVTKQWAKLTFSTYSLNTNVGVGGAAYADATILQSNAGSPGVYGTPTIDESGYANSRGTVKATNTFAVGAATIEMENIYTLNAGDSFVKVTTTLKNTTGSSVDNVRLWAGTQDDWVNTTDHPTKTKGNLSSSGFTAISTASDQAKALQITAGSASTDAGVLFFSTSSGANTLIKLLLGANFQTQDPLTSPITATGDDSYAMYNNFGTLANGATGQMVWYYAAGNVGSLATIATSVNTAAAAPTTTTTTTTTTIPQTAAVQTAQTQLVSAVPLGDAPPLGPSLTLAQPPLVTQGTAGLPPLTIGSLQVVEISSTGSSGDGSTPATTVGTTTAPASDLDTSTAPGGDGTATALDKPAEELAEEQSLALAANQADPSGLMKMVFVMDGGIRLPSDSESDSDSKSNR